MRMKPNADMPKTAMKQKPAGPGNPGAEKKADVGAAQKSQPGKTNSLRGAVMHLGASKAPRNPLKGR